MKESEERETYTERLIIFGILLGTLIGIICNIGWRYG